MLFNSPTFILLFLPLSLIAFYAAGRIGGGGWAKTSLVLFSLLFYVWWNPPFLLLLCGSVLFNYAVGTLIIRLRDEEKKQQAALFVGVAANVALLFYYKYLFVLLHGLEGFGFNIPSSPGNVLLPLGISFFTFTQIGYLVDCQAGLIKTRSFLNYILFVTIFPHLIAGPILHHKEIIPQLNKSESFKLKSDHLAIGLTLFTIGLFKKVVIADHFADYAKLVFDQSDAQPLAAVWGGVLSYSLQLYFDFSGYSDMAIGLARLFGVRFPANFNSPYKSTSIIDFWQRWHMTLTRYLTLYIYNPIALCIARRRQKQGKPVSAAAAATFEGFTSMIALPTFVTITLAGVWHGAGWQFVIFGLLHGAYLCINHAARLWGPKEWKSPRLITSLITASKVLLTYFCVLIAQIFFRATSAPDAIRILKNMAGMDMSEISNHATKGLDFAETFLGLCGVPIEAALNDLHFDAPFTVMLGFLFVWFLPNSLQIMARAEPSLTKISRSYSLLEWRPNGVWGVLMGCLAMVALMAITGTREFIYFQF